ncbi:MAG TPA: DUF2950 family protein [Planctomycetota bacterium]|nr:DUF2950 family protein [Planctomycetota bacterium]
MTEGGPEEDLGDGLIRFHSRLRIVGPYLLVVGLLGIGTFIVWPQWRDHRIAENQRDAGNAIKTLTSAEAVYRADDLDGNGVHDFWTGDVAGLYRYGLIERGVAEADVRPIHPLVPKPVPFHGYYFVSMLRDESEPPIEDLRLDTDGRSGKVHHLLRFGFCAYPAEFGVTGRWTFIVNENNTVFWRRTNGDPMDYWPCHEEQRQDWGLGRRGAGPDPLHACPRREPGRYFLADLAWGRPLVPTRSLESAMSSIHTVKPLPACW